MSSQILLVLIFLPSVIGDACSNPMHWSGVKNVTIEVGSITRTFQLSTPWQGGNCGFQNKSWCTGPPSIKTSLVFNWHGCSGHVPVLDYAEEISRMVDAAKDHGWYAITPVGTRTIYGDYGWNADGIECGSVGVDDFAFFEALMNFTETELCVDMDRVHTAGFSTGAFLSYGIACRYPDQIFAAGTDAGGLSHPEYHKCLSGQGAVPMQSFHSLTDPTVPYNGTDVWVGQEKMNELWRDRNGCDGSEIPTTTFSTETANCQKWDCADAPVEACTLQNIDHCWYGGRSGGFQSCVARSTDVDATTTMFNSWLQLADESR
mmetsp:Transcript_32240/g.41434  ORF Transcript_32240/g.41434 Transcript_32240/m.41434 type:complete len:318 (+) Transcript_32240:13-966(+)